MTDNECFKRFWSKTYRSLLVRSMFFGSILAGLWILGALRWDRNTLITIPIFIAGFAIIYLPEFLFSLRPCQTVFNKNKKLMTSFRNEILQVGKADMIRKSGFSRVVKEKTEELQ